MNRHWCWLYLLPWCVAGMVLLWLFEQRVPLSGSRELKVVLDGRAPWFDPFLPWQRATPMGPQPGGWFGQTIFQDPVYASLRLPGVYTKASIGLDFRPYKQSLLELGVRQDPGGSGFAMQPFWSQVLSEGWRKVEWRGRSGYVRAGESASRLEEEDMGKLLTWHASSTSPRWMDDDGKPREYKLALRGSHDFHVVPVKGAIEFEFSFQDMNRQPQPSSLVLSLSKDGVLLWSEAVSLPTPQVSRPSQVLIKRVRFDDQQSGVYKLAVVADDDIFMRSIKTNMRRWVVGPRLYFGDQVGYARDAWPGKVWTNAHHLLMSTFHQEGLQTVTLGSTRVELTSTHTEYHLDRRPEDRLGQQKLLAPKGDVRLVGDGYFAFDPDSLFLPAPRRLTDTSDPVAEGIVAILTPYAVPTQLDDGWYEGRVEAALRPRPGALKVVLAAPGMRERKGAVDVRAARLVYSRPDLGWGGWLSAVRQEAIGVWKKL